MTHKMISDPYLRKAMARTLWQARKLRQFGSAEFTATCYGIESAFWELTKMSIEGSINPIIRMKQ